MAFLPVIALPKFHKASPPPRTSRSIKACIPSTPRPTSLPDSTWRPFIPSTEPCVSIPTEQDSGNIPKDPISNGGDDREDAPEDPDELLKRFGREGEELPAQIRSLPSADLEAYLAGTQSPLSRFLASIWPGWRNRVAADPDFPFKVLMEETVGLGLAASGMIAARGKNIIAELDFAICDIAVGGTLNFILVYLLTPSLGAASAGRMASLPANVFSAGAFSPLQRMGTFLYKGSLFAVCGFAGSVLGTTLSKGLVFVRRVVFKQETNLKLPNVAANSAAWAGFMFFSSNPRYQAVAGCERALFSMAPESVAKLGSGLLRTGNNVLGGANWVWWARAIGLQKKEE